MQARSGGARTPAFAPGTGTRALGEPSEPTDERGDPAPVIQVRGAGHSCASLHSRHRYLPARKSGVPFLSVPCFGHAKKGTRRTGVGEPEVCQESSGLLAPRTGLPRTASTGLASESTESGAQQAR